MYGSRVWRYISRLVGRDKGEVADVFQETMLAVAKAGRSVKGGEDSRLWAWLAKIAHNQAALYWRRVYRERARQGDIEFDIEFDRAALEEKLDPAQLADQSETIRLVRYVLAQMPSDYVVLLVGKYMDDQSVLQIVNAVGGTKESVRSRLARARREFRERFDDVASGRCRLDGSIWQELSSDVSNQS